MMLCLLAAALFLQVKSTQVVEEATKVITLNLRENNRVAYLDPGLTSFVTYNDEDIQVTLTNGRI